MVWFRFRRRQRHCAHMMLQGIYGDAINIYKYRLMCTVCGQLLEGPVELAKHRTESERKFY